MTPRARNWFWGIVAAQVLFLLVWAGYHEVVRSSAPVILLKTRPVDPRDLLRGDYMILRYEIATVKPAGAGETLKAGESYWVVLEKRGRYHEAVAVSREEPTLRSEQIAVKADEDGGTLKFGIEQFFVPEGKGTPKFKLMEVEAVVGPLHRLNLKRVLLDGKPYPK